MPTATVTYTGVMGPGTTITSQAFANTTRLLLDFAKGTGEITFGTPSKIAIVSINSTTTITDTIASGVHTIVISQ